MRGRRATSHMGAPSTSTPWRCGALGHYGTDMLGSFDRLHALMHAAITSMTAPPASANSAPLTSDKPDPARGPTACRAVADAVVRARARRRSRHLRAARRVVGVVLARQHGGRAPADCGVRQSCSIRRRRRIGRPEKSPTAGGVAAGRPEEIRDRHRGAGARRVVVVSPAGRFGRVAGWRPGTGRARSGAGPTAGQLPAPFCSRKTSNRSSGSTSGCRPPRAWSGSAPCIVRRAGPTRRTVLLPGGSSRCWRNSAPAGWRAGSSTPRFACPPFCILQTTSYHA